MGEILLDKNGEKEFNKRLEEARNKVDDIGRVLGESFRDYVGDGWHDNPAYEDAMRKSSMIDDEINRLLVQKKQIRVIEDKYNDKLTNIGDIIKIEFVYSDNDRETEIVRLTGNYIPNMDSDIKEITLNSPVGRAIYKKKIGGSCSYKVSEKEVIINIIERVK